MVSFHYSAPAKINLHLHVVGKRADGYHLLESLVVFTEIADSITVAPAGTLSLHSEGPFAAALESENNIILKAAKRLADYAGIAPHASITLQKHIPLGAGLGGGSSDAAATLHALGVLWGLAPDVTTLKALAVQLGADVPVFIERQAAFVSGIGEQVRPVAALPELYAVLVNPGIHLATPEVFGLGVAAFSPPEKDVEGVCRMVSKEALLAYVRRCRNDLETPAIQLAPVVASVLSVLNAQEACLVARMSGSGSTCFGLFASREAAENAATAIRGSYPQWWVQATKLLGTF